MRLRLTRFLQLVSLFLLSLLTLLTSASNPNPNSESSSPTTLFPLSTKNQYGSIPSSSAGSLKWQLKNSNGSIDVGAWFPSVAHLDLMRHGIVDSPDVGLNEGTERWIVMENWTYTASLKPLIGDGKLGGYDMYLLIFDGLDTVCNITIGDQPVAWVNNQFRRWEFDVTPQINSLLSSKSSHDHNLTLSFESAITYVRNVSSQPDAEYFPTTGHAPTSLVYEYDNRNWIRKQQSDFGWDWGPAYVPQGPHKEGWIVGIGQSTSSSSSSHSTAAKRNGTLAAWQSIPEKQDADGAEDVSEKAFRIRRKVEENDAFWDERNVEQGEERDKTFSSRIIRSSKSSKAVTSSSSSTSSGNNSDAPVNGIYISTTSIDIYRQGQQNNLPPSQTAPWILNISLSLWSTTAYPSPTLDLSLEGTDLSSGKLEIDSIKKGWNKNLSAVWRLDGSGDNAPKLWWPANMGTPKLYQLEIHLSSGNPMNSLSSALSSASEGNANQLSKGVDVKWKERTGFRTVVVNQERVTDEEVSKGIKPGSKFQFEINGKPFFVQGSSVIPFDTFYPRIPKERIKWYIHSAILAGQNLLRIWGGASYQSEDFYDLCDEMGILAWSENIAACSMYPVDDWFVDNNVNELEENVRRVNRHPSNSLWAGNNEGEGYMLSAYKKLDNGTIYYNQYGYLFDEALRGAVLRNTKSISYIPSSTTQGYLSLDPYVPRYSNKTDGETYGDQEHYNYNTTLSFNLSSYPQARFVNEFGFHSMASVYSYDAVLTSPGEYTYNGTEVANHNKHNPPGNLSYPYFPADGQAQMAEAVEAFYPVPDLPGEKRREFAQWAYSTQVFQAAFMAAEISFYRLGASRPEHNLGAVYWQLNDEPNWTGATWSSMESIGGRWKVFHYLAQRTQAHVIVNPIYYNLNQTLEIFITSDLFDSAKGKATWTWYDFKGNRLESGATTTKSFQVGPINSTLLYRSPSNDLSALIPGGHDPNDAWLHLEVNATSGEKSYYNEQFFQPLPLSSSPLTNPKLSVNGIGDSLFEVTNNGEGVAAWVNVEQAPAVMGWFSEPAKDDLPSNDFYLRPGEKRVLKFNVWKDETDGEWSRKMKVRSIWDNNH